MDTVGVVLRPRRGRDFKITDRIAKHIRHPDAPESLGSSASELVATVAGVSGSAIDANAITGTKTAGLQRATLQAACAAVVAVKPNVDTRIAAQRRTRGAIVADHLAATRCCCGADVAARAAVGRIGTQERAGSVTADSTRDPVVRAKSGAAQDSPLATSPLPLTP